MICAEVKRFQMPPVAQIPDMNRMTVLVSEEQLGHDAVLDHFRRTPFAGDGNFPAEMPPEIVRELLWAAIDFPSPEHVEAFVIEQENSARPVALWISNRADVNRIGPAMHRMRPAVSRARRNLVGLDRLMGAIGPATIVIVSVAIGTLIVSIMSALLSITELAQ